MAAKRNNGPVLWQMRFAPIDPHDNRGIFRTFHANGHILQKTSGGSWKQWAIVPIDALGNVADYLESHGWEYDA